jgi:two-component system nitrate/nitrite response regulator NarL
MLYKCRQVECVADIQQGDAAIRCASVEQPDIIFTGADIPHLPVVALVQELRAASPTSRIIVIGKLLDGACHVQLTNLGTRGFLLWKDVTEETLRPILEIVRSNVCVESTAVVERRGAVDRRRGPRASDIVLTAEERVVLTDLADGWTQQEIAERLHMSESTVKRIIVVLRSKFAVTTTYALCAQAGRFGFLSSTTTLLR